MTGVPSDDLAAPITTTRLRLMVVPSETLRAISELGPDDEVIWPGVGPVPRQLAETMPASMRIRQAEADPAIAAWLIRGIVVDDPSSDTRARLIGHIGGHDRPDEHGMVEVGYTVAEADRGRGVATEAARAWFGWAHRHGGRVARLSVERSNAPSVAIARRLGLRAGEEIWDEDDQVWEVVFEAPLPLVSTPL